MCRERWSCCLSTELCAVFSFQKKNFSLIPLHLQAELNHQTRAVVTSVLQKGGRRTWLKAPEVFHAISVLEVQQVDENEGVNVQQAAAGRGAQGAGPAPRGSAEAVAGT